MINTIPIAVYGTSGIFVIPGPQQGCSTVRSEDHVPSVAPQGCVSLRISGDGSRVGTQWKTCMVMQHPQKL